MTRADRLCIVMLAFYVSHPQLIDCLFFFWIALLTATGKGSMGPKVEAAARFAEKSGKTAIITSLDKVT